MKKIIIIFSMLTCSLTAYCQHSYKQQLGNIAAITFPDTPTKKGDKNGLLYSFNTRGVYYISQVFPVKENLMEMFTQHMNDSVCARFITASIKKYEGTLFYKKNIVANGLKGVEYGYKAMSDSVIYYRYRQIFYFNNTFIVIGLSSADSLKANNTETRAFFKTFKPTITNSKIEQDNLVDVIFTWRFGLYTIITIVLLTLLIALIAFIIKKLANK